MRLSREELLKQYPYWNEKNNDIDGKFEEDKKDVRLRLRGSSNQKIWHILHKEEENLLLEATEDKGWRE